MNKTTGLTNKEIENLAIKFVKTKYPNAKSMPHGSGYDLEIGGKIVEVKGTASDKYKQNIFFSRSKEHDVWLNNKEKYWLFRVFNVGSQNIELVEISGRDIEPIKDPRWRIKINRP